jgi:hypothetical protein
MYVLFRCTSHFSFHFIIKKNCRVPVSPNYKSK